MALLEHVLQGLINTRLPAVAAVLHRFGLHPTMFAAQWILTVFTYNFPFAVVVRVWDVFIAEGWKVVFRIALAALKAVAADFARCASFEDVMVTFRELPGKLDADGLLTAAFDVSLSGKDIEALEAEYKDITAKGFEHSTAAAGHGLAAHERQKKKDEEERQRKRLARAAAAAARK